MTDLLPCPFCGAPAERIDIEDGENSGGSCVHCTKCDACSNVEFEFKENFVSNWNRRATVEHLITEAVGAVRAAYLEGCNQANGSAHPTMQRKASAYADRVLEHLESLARAEGRSE